MVDLSIILLSIIIGFCFASMLLLADAQFSVGKKPSIIFNLQCIVAGGHITTFNVTNTGVCMK